MPAKNLPLVVFPHGGPWGRDYWGYDTFAQFFSNRGYAVLQPNFRASTGYGKKFLNAGNGEWGRKMQDDLTWGVKALVADGTVDAKRVGIAGGSYGGYATLAGVAFTPDVYAAAVAIVAPSNLITLLDAIPPYWEAGRKQMYTRMADPTTPDGKALLIAESPLTKAKDHRDAADGGAGQERSAREYSREQPDCCGGARQRQTGGVPGGAGRGARICAADQQPGDGDGDGGVSAEVSRRTLSEGCSGGCRGEAEGVDRRSEDR